MSPTSFFSRPLARALAAGACVTIALAGCGKSGGDTDKADFSAEPSGTLKTLGYNPDDEVGKSRSDYAAQQLSDVDVQMDTSSFDPQKFVALSASGNVPDVVQMDRSAIATYAQKDLIMPLDACFDAQSVDPAKHWYPAIVQEVTVDDDVYAAPQFFQPSMIIMNKRLMEEAGVTEDMLDTSDPEAFVSTVEKMAKLDGGKPIQLGFDPDVPGSMVQWFHVFGGAESDESGAPTLDSPENVKAMEWLKRLMDAQGGYAEVTSFKQTWDVFGDENQYVTDATGGGIWGQWYLNVLAGTKDDVDIVTIPMRDSQGQPFAMSGGSALAIPTNAKNPTAACAWIVDATSDEAWAAAGDARAKTVETDGGFNTGLFTGVPAADQAVREAHVTETGDADFDQSITAMYDVLDHPVSRGASPVGATIDEAVANAAGAAMNGDKTPQQALTDAQATAQAEYDKIAK